MVIIQVEKLIRKKIGTYINRLSLVTFQKQLSKEISKSRSDVSLWKRKLADLKINDVVFNVGLYENKLLVQFKGIFYLVDNRLSGLLDKKSLISRS